jgi:hypothetical protein
MKLIIMKIDIVVLLVKQKQNDHLQPKLKQTIEITTQ